MRKHVADPTTNPADGRANGCRQDQGWDIAGRVNISQQVVQGVGVGVAALREGEQLMEGVARQEATGERVVIAGPQVDQPRR